MDKKPLIPISEKPIDVWYESPSVMIVKKPAGLKVHPDNETEKDTLLNRLFQHNRWLAEMESSLQAGVLHLFAPDDHGLMVFNKTDDYQELLENALTENNISFSYIIQTKGTPSIDLKKAERFNLKMKSKKQQAGFTILDVTSTEGNTPKLREALFPEAEKTTFYCYEIGLTLPHSGDSHTTSLLDTERGIPHLEVYHAPP